MSDPFSVEELIARGPAFASDWISQVGGCCPDLVSPFNWVGLVEMTSNLARSFSGDDSPERERLAWADIAMQSLGLAQSVGAVSEYYVRAHELALRCTLVSRLGARRRPQWLDPDRITTLFRETVSVSLIDAKRMSIDFPAIGRDEMLELRRTKNLLASISGVREALDVGERSRLVDWDEWFELLPSLP